MDPEITPPSAPSPATTDQTSPPATSEPAVADQPERTVEQVEAEWQRRFGARDRAHNAAEEVLQEQVGTLQRQLDASRRTGQPAEAAEDTETAELRRALAQSEQRRVAAERKSKYPRLAEFLGADDTLFAAATEVQLAKLNSSFESPSNGGTLIAPTAPKRTAPVAAKPFSEKSKEELLDDLKRTAPAYQAWEREQRGS